MPRVRIVHSTEYNYAAPVTISEHRLMMRPRDSHDLRLLDATLGIVPAGATIRWSHDVFGNSICYLAWPKGRTDFLRIVSTLDLEHYPGHEALPIEPAAETYPFRYAGDEYPDLSRLIEPHYPDPDRQVEAWARRFLRPGGNTQTRELLIAMTEAIKSDFAYEARETKGTHAPLETLASKRGACRDFAVLMMEAARSLGFAARFVSGYLYDPALIDCVAPMVGGGTTHAWCAIYLPGAGWVEYDPTNGLVAGRNLIRVCTAREPHQATPLSGGYVGRPEDFLDMTVNVEVMVGDPPGFDIRAKDAVGGAPKVRLPAAVTAAPRPPEAKVAAAAARVAEAEASLDDLDLTPS